MTTPIERLYEELGRELSRDYDAEANAMRVRHGVERQQLATQQEEEIKAAGAAWDKHAHRVRVLREAIKLANEGMDPLQAKIFASEHVEEAAEKANNLPLPHIDNAPVIISTTGNLVGIGAKRGWTK